MAIVISGSGTITGLSAGGLPDDCITNTNIATGAITNDSLASGVGGKVLQVVSTAKTDASTMTNTTFTQVSGLSVNITPSSTSSKILLMCTYNIGGSSSTQAYSALFRDDTQIALGDANGNRIRSSTQQIENQTNEITSSGITFLDSPSTTAQITYGIRSRTQGSSTIYINRGVTWSNSAQSATNCSVITAMEISA